MYIRTDMVDVHRPEVAVSDHPAHDMDPAPLMFVSYRRSDTKTKVASLVRDLALSFGPESIFLDTDRIRAAAKWKEEIQSALERATVLLVAIGDKWFSVTDSYHRRRIDNADDWVRQEIRHALEAGKPVLPIRFDGQGSLEPEALPDELRRLADLQSIELRESDWREDLGKILRRLQDFGFQSSARPVLYPNPVIKEPVASEGEVREFLRRYPDWQVQYRPHPTDPGSQRRGIGTMLTFRSFRDAIHFMSTASWGIDERNHHPEWENIWQAVIIWITQFDIGGDITGRNIELAEYLMSVYEPYAKVRPD